MNKRAALAVALTATLGAGCGGDDGNKQSGPLKVSAATSLKAALTEYAKTQGDVALSFAGSDQLAAQIRQGARPDVFAAANVKLPDDLFAEGLVQEPVVFAANRLVLAVPAGSTDVRSLADLDEPGVKIAIGAKGVPVGDYARELLTEKALENVRSEEPDVAGVVGKIAQGAVDAGFVYATDVKAAGDRLTEIALPAPKVRYAAAVVKDSAKARRFVQGLKNAPALQAAGFEAP
jgi:molybdate transport system substrate-binding protein